MTSRQEWKASFQNVTEVCKSCQQKRRLEVEDRAVQFGVRWEPIMRLAVRFAIGLALAMGATGSTQAVSQISRARKVLCRPMISSMIDSGSSF